MTFNNHRIYHFRPDKEQRDLNTLKEGKMWSSRIDKLNDPFEFSALHSLDNHPDKQSEFMNAGVTCFCRSLTNPLIWSHYAASHKGFAIGFDAAHPFFGGDKGLGHRFLLDVRYEDIPPTLDVFSIDELVMAAVLTKPTCWAYEQEVRLIKQHGDHLFEIPKDSIKEILFGAKMQECRIETIMKDLCASGIKAKFGRMKCIKEGYGVRPEWIS